jgi:hypothetical protein
MDLLYFSIIDEMYYPRRWFRPPETTGKLRKITVSGRKAPEINGNGSSTPDQEIIELSRRVPAVSHRKEQEFGRKITEKSENFPVRNTASMKSPEFSGTGHFLAALSHLGTI